MNKDAFDVLTLVVAGCALGATFWQGLLAWKHNRLIIKPLLAWQRAVDITDAGVEISFLITNTGVGPAVTREWYFTYGGQRFSVPEGQDVIMALAQKVIGHRFQHKLRAHGLPGLGTALPAAASHTIARVFFPGMGRHVVDALEGAGEVSFHLRYESLYGESWWLKVP